MSVRYTAFLYMLKVSLEKNILFIKYSLFFLVVKIKKSDISLALGEKNTKISDKF